MGRGGPSLMALLGLVAVAGYKNRGKLSEMMGSGQTGQTGMQSGAMSGQSGGVGGILGELGGMLGIGGASQSAQGGMMGSQAGAQGGGLSGGLNELMDKFRGSGMGHKAESWVSDGTNHEVDATELETALGPDMVAELQQKTGLSRDDLLSRLSQALPDTVNRFTPAGRLPTDEEAREFY